MLVFRHADRRLPYLWESDGQPPGRWHGTGEGPAHNFAGTPDGAWAEFLRHEGISSPKDLETIIRAMWVVDVPDGSHAEPQLPEPILTGGTGTWTACRAEARRLRDAGATILRSPSAALLGGGASGWRVDGGLRAGPVRDGVTWTLFGARPDLVGWRAAVGRPAEDLLTTVRHLD